MIGSEGYALYIRDWYAERYELYCKGDIPYGHLNETVPAGWQRLGAGCSRTAFLSPDGVVYKVQQGYGHGWGQSNEQEWRNYNRFRLSHRLPQGARFPRWSFYRLDGRGVIASERFIRLLNDFSQYSDEGSTLWSLRGKVADQLNLWDMHGANLGVDEETMELVPIDLGES